MDDIQVCNEKIEQIWAEKEETYKNAQDFFRFAKEAEEEIAWIEDTKDQLEAAAEQKLENIEKAENAQLELNALSAAIAANQPKIKSLIAQDLKFRDEEAAEKKEKLKILAEELENKQENVAEKITNALNLHRFMEDAKELDELIELKLKDTDASDPKDLVDLPKKSQQNQNLKNDIAANQNRITALQEDAAVVIDEEGVVDTLQNVEEKWDKLQTAVEDSKLTIIYILVYYHYIRFHSFNFTLKYFSDLNI